jgi:MIP family channel proteins
VPRDWFRRAVAEFVGAFTLVFAGMGAIMFGSSAGLTGIALAHGLAIAVMVSAVGHISGGHFNPAITFAFLLAGRMNAALAAIYAVSQLVAGAVAALLLNVIFPVNLDPGVPVVARTVGGGSAVLAEAILTFFLVWVVFATAADARGTFKSIAGLAIGLTITLDILAAGPLTGAAMNPARALGPELVQNVWNHWWVYWVGPLAGGGVAGLVYELLYLRPLEPAVVGPPETGLEEPRPGETAVS